jgi:hypothetical protein
MTYPGPGSPQALTQQSPTRFNFQTGAFANQAAMDAAYPKGTYSFTATGATTDTTSFQYSADDYPGAQPFLTGTSYSDLQGMNASQAITLGFSPFVAGSTANQSTIFLTIFDLTTNTYAFIGNGLPHTTTSFTLPANTLAAGHSFIYELDYSNRDFVPAPGSIFAAQLGFDVRTQGDFSTAVATPLPSSASAGLMLLLGAGIWRAFKKRAVIG